MKKILLLVLIFVSVFSNSQQHSKKQIDSLLDATNNIGNSNPKEAIKLNEKIYKNSEKINYSFGMIQSLGNISHYYYITGNPEKSIKYASLEQTIAEKLNDYENVSASLRLQAASFSTLGFYDEAEEKLKKAFAISGKIPDSDAKHKIRGLLYAAKTTIVINKNPNIKSPSLLEYHKQSIDEFLKIKSKKTRDRQLYVAYCNLSMEYLDIAKYDSAIYYLKKSETLSNFKDKNNEYIVLYNYGSIYYSKGEYQKAVDYFEKVVEKAKNYKDPYVLRTTFQSLDSCYVKLNNKEKSNEYLLKYSTLNDSLVNAEKASLKVPLKEITKEKEKAFNKTKTELYIIIALSVLLIIVCLYFVFRYFKNYQTEKKEKFSKEFTILENESKLNQLESKINDAFEEVLELAKTDDPAFLARFKEVYPEFYNKLASNYPNLTISQLRFCAMLKLNFSTKEIAHYHHTTIRGIQNKKNRLRKELNLSSEEDLNKWTMSLI